MKRTNLKHNEFGLEIVSPKPMQPPLGYKRAPSLSEQIRQQVLAHKLEMLEHLEETEEEADDFEVEDDFEPASPHENEHMPTVKELRLRAKEINEEVKRRNLENLRDQLKRENDAKRGVPEAPPSRTSSETPPK